jgi:DNA-binding XRE family transcriptional regulator
MSILTRPDGGVKYHAEHSDTLPEMEPHMNDRARVGAEIRRLREAQGLTQADVAYFSSPCSPIAVSRLERGDLSVSPGLKSRIARTLGVPVQELFPLEAVA